MTRSEIEQDNPVDRADNERREGLRRAAEDIRRAAACRAEFAERMAKHRPIDAPSNEYFGDEPLHGSGAIVAYIIIIAGILGIALMIYGSVS